MTYNEAATKYGVPVERIRRESMDFLQCEGYLDNGHECMTLAEWLEYRLTSKAWTRPSFEPWQKGDECPE